jgi:hypothetical protein
MPDEHVPTDVDQDAGPPGNGVTDQPGPHPDPPVADEQEIDDAADDGQQEAADDDVDERSKLSFPTSDPPATWAGTDQPD